MDFVMRSKMTGIIIGILVFLNVSTLGTMWFLHANRPMREQPQRPQQQGNRDLMPFLQRELNLNSDQVKRFRDLQYDYFKAVDTIRDEIHELKRSASEELFQEIPDTKKVDGIAETIGQKQAELEKLTFHHFLAMKSLCTGDQAQKLEALLHELFEFIRPEQPRRGEPQELQGRENPQHRPGDGRRPPPRDGRRPPPQRDGRRPPPPDDRP